MSGNQWWVSRHNQEWQIGAGKTNGVEFQTIQLFWPKKNQK